MKRSWTSGARPWSELRAIVTPDPDGDNGGPNYGTKFAESDYAAIPRRDLPFGAPAFLGDDAWVRAQPGGAQNSVARPSPDDGHTLIWHAPDVTDRQGVEEAMASIDEHGPFEAAYTAGVVDPGTTPRRRGNGGGRCVARGAAARRSRSGAAC